MIRLDDLAALTLSPGPYATAYLDATRKTEEGAEEVALRWRALREDLAAHGADEATLEAMSSALAEPDHVPGEHGRVLVGRGGQVRYDAVLPRPPRWQSSRWSPLPHLMPMVAALAPLVPHVVAIVDRTGGDVEVTGPRGQEEREVRGREYPVHKSGAGGWSSLRYQHRTEHTWTANARAVADEVDSAVRRVGARLVIVAGDVRERAELLDELGEAARAVPGLRVEDRERFVARGGDRARDRRRPVRRGGPGVSPAATRSPASARQVGTVVVLAPLHGAMNMALCNSVREHTVRTGRTGHRAKST